MKKQLLLLLRIQLVLIRLRRLELSFSELRGYKCTPRQWVHSEHLSRISLNHFLRPAIVILQDCNWCP